ncbi:type III pantothenate kinase [Paraburkholderia lycopersici]|uniref:Type III pantothenate kinase n=1 Tax=Paraburkholderia lycopersici TaxID=416944 RepID=A0A1G6GWB2_9BURK|nr:type III pantothenate kinase [Paraburkholderia lycopersici]SDB86269.1 type III pantothenate kinase [Paraburkholderia lycopersici]
MSRGPCLLIDAGNSRIKWALVAPDGSRLHAGAMDHLRDEGGQPAPAGLAEWATLPRPRGAWISNVAGRAVGERLDALVEAHWSGLSRIVVRACAQQCGVTNSYATPDALGSDRWAGMIGAHAAYPDEPLLIATFGTATTLEALCADGTFVGGMIAPGFALMTRSLGEHTAQLPVVEGGMADAPRPGIAFATDTRRSISAGCALAQAALVERAWFDLQDAWKVPVRLVVSGGAAAEVTAALKVPHTRHDALVLSGLALIAAQS